MLSSKIYSSQRRWSVKNMNYPVEIVDYDPQWPVVYGEEKGRILDVIGRRIVAIEHVGSTAIPGLAAKPIIDIMVAVRRLADAEECIEPLQSIGYEYVPEFEAELPERRFFRKGPPEARTHHIHMIELTSEFWERHLLFRDYLRSHPDVAQQYYKLKKELADRYGSDREAYADAKTPFIESVLAMAHVDESIH